MHANGNPLLPYNKTVLDNGLTLLHKEVRTAPIVAVDIWIKTGAVNDPEPHLGLSHFFEHMFFKGTERHGVGEMDRIITELGGYNNAATSLDYTHYFVVLPSMGWKQALDVLMDSLMNPLFDAEEVERERQVIVEEIKRHEDSPWSKIYDEFIQAAFAKCRYSRKVLGTVESLQTISRDTFVDYHRARYCPENVTLCVIGDLSLQEMQDELGRITRNYTNFAPLQDETLNWDLIDESADVFMRRDVNQSYFLIGYPTPRLTGTRDEYAMDTLSAILGDGRSSRLFRRLNDELGIVSSISCSYWSLANAGLFIIEAVTDPAKLPQVEKEIEEQLAKVRERISDEELDKVKSMARADFAFANEKVISIANTYGYGSVVTSLEHAVTYLENIEKTSIQEIQQSFDNFITGERRCKATLLPNG